MSGEGPQRPIFIIGAARSGTTVLGDLLASHPDVAYWVEPRYVWRHGAHGSPHDARRPEDATPDVARSIRRRFSDFQRRRGAARFMEKTPSNCFRVGFVHRIFPDGLFLHLVRDGRDAAASALERWRGAPDDRAMLRRLRRFEVPLTAIHHYLPDLVREAVLRRLRPGRGYVWGPRYPGLAEDLEREDVTTLCARQWALSARAAATELAALPAGQVFTIRYEALLRDPAATLDRIRRFLALAPHQDLESAAQGVRAEGSRRFAQLPEREQRVIADICLPVMRDLGWSGSEGTAS